MKTTAAIGIITTALGFCAFAAQTNQTSTPNPVTAAKSPEETSVAALRRAMGANQYAFVFFYENDDEATQAARKTFDAAMQKLAPTPLAVAVNRTAPTEKEIVEKFAVEHAPMPLVLAVAPNGAVTGGIKAADLTRERLQEAVASPAMQQCLKALQDQKLVFVCVQNARTKANEAAMKGVNEFKADPRSGEECEIVKVDPADTKEAKLLAQLKVDPKCKTASTALLVPPGMVATKVEGATSKADLEAALRKAAASCAPGSGCCSAPK